jgi:ribose 5-phosphate isomerase B
VRAAQRRLERQRYEDSAIHQLGSHRGKHVVFGYDRYLLPELDGYLLALSKFGIVVPAVPVATVAADALHYLTSAERACERVSGAVDHVGVLICSTGMGMSIAANKFRGVYAARCLDAEDAVLARTINNANVLCLATRTTLAHNERIIDAFMTTAYDGRKLEQLERIASIGLELDR